MNSDEDALPAKRHLDRLESLRQQLITAEVEIVRLREERAKAVGQALVDGVQITKISRASGLSRQWIYKTKNARP